MKGLDVGIDVFGAKIRYKQPIQLLTKEAPRGRDESYSAEGCRGRQRRDEPAVS
jgi:hypothetical protein